jgi:hypothetical protein
MFNDLTALGYGLVVFAIIIGVGTVVLYNFSSATANCPTAYSTYNATSELCQNATGSTVNPSQATINSNYLTGQLGQTGLAGWTPAIIAISVGLLFLGAFLVRGGRKGRY